MPALSTVLDVAIGLVFVFLLISLAATWVQEYVATLLKLRAKHLLNVLQNLLDPPAGKLNGLEVLKQEWSKGVKDGAIPKLNDNVLKTLYEHPVIKGLAQPAQQPSFIASREITTALLDMFVKAGTAASPGAAGLESLKAGIQKLRSESAKTALLALVDEAAATEKEAEKKIAAARKSMEDWFDASMDRATGWYKRSSQVIAVAIGLALALLLNADTIGLAQTLWRDAALRSYLTAAATTFAEKGDKDQTANAIQELEALPIPIGWSFKADDGDPATPVDPRDFPVTLGGWVLKIVGLLITGLAVSQGSPIWFDFLGRFVNMRNAGGKPEPASLPATQK